MFLRARLKSAYNSAMSSASLMFAGTIECTNIIYFYAGGHDYIFNQQYALHIKAEPGCRHTYEIGKPGYNDRAFICGDGTKHKFYDQKFLHLSGQTYWEPYKTWLNENWVNYLVIPAGVIMAGFAVYGFLFPEAGFIEEERQRQPKLTKEASTQTASEVTKSTNNASTQTEPEDKNFLKSTADASIQTEQNKPQLNHISTQTESEEKNNLATKSMKDFSSQADFGLSVSTIDDNHFSKVSESKAHNTLKIKEPKTIKTDQTKTDDSSTKNSSGKQTTLSRLSQFGSLKNETRLRKRKSSSTMAISATGDEFVLIEKETPSRKPS